MERLFQALMEAIVMGDGSRTDLSFLKKKQATKEDVKIIKGILQSKPNFDDEKLNEFWSGSKEYLQALAAFVGAPLLYSPDISNVDRFIRGLYLSTKRHGVEWLVSTDYTDFFEIYRAMRYGFRFYDPVEFYCKGYKFAFNNSGSLLLKIDRNWRVFRPALYSRPEDGVFISTLDGQQHTVPSAVKEGGAEVMVLCINDVERNKKSRVWTIRGSLVFHDGFKQVELLGRPLQTPEWLSVIYNGYGLGKHA